MDKEKLILRQSELARTIEAIGEVLKSNAWKVLKETFETRVLSLDKQLLGEAKKPKLEEEKIYFLQGQLSEAKRYDLATYQDTLRKELQGIKQNLQ